MKSPYLCKDTYLKKKPMEITDNVIISHSFDGLGEEARADYLAHAFCTGGSCRFLFNGREFGMCSGDLMIVRKARLLDRIEPSDDFEVTVIYVTPGFIELSTPQSNYGMKGQLALFLNPVMHLTPEQQEACRHDFQMVERRLRATDHHFYRDTLIAAIQMLIIDFFDFHSHLYGTADVSTQNASIMNRFLTMLENGEYRKNREVAYYADCLCVTPKYLSEVSKKVSGYSANYWINRYTSLDIARLLRDKSLTFVRISDMFGFSSPAYFSRYVQRNLGMNPTEYRE